MGNEKIGARAAAAMRRGLHCSEAILSTFDGELRLALGDTALKAASGFAGGIGRSRDLCGALAGAVMVIGALYGRAKPGVDDRVCQELCGKLREDFVAEFGSSSCAVLAKTAWGAPNQLDLCADRITARTAELLQELLRQQEKPATANG